MHRVGVVTSINQESHTLLLPVGMNRARGDRRVGTPRFGRSGCPAFGFWLSLPNMARHIVHYLTESEGLAVVFLPGIKAYCVFLAQLATVRSIGAAPVAAKGCFNWPGPDGGLTYYPCLRSRKMALKLNFRTTG